MTHSLTNFYQKYEKRKTGNPKKVVLIIVVLVLVFVLIFSLVLGKKSDKIYEGNAFYFVYANKVFSSAPATELAKEVSERGGAGVVYAIGTNLFVVAGAYLSQADATSVKNNLSKTYATSGTLKVESAKLSKKNIRAIESDSVNKNYYKELLDFCKYLCNLSLNYDKGEITSSEIYRGIMQYRSNITSIAEGLKSRQTSVAKTMHASSMVILEHISGFFSSAFVGSNMTAYIKKLQINAIIEFVDMCALI